MDYRVIEKIGTFKKGQKLVSWSPSRLKRFCREKGVRAWDYFCPDDVDRHYTERQPFELQPEERVPLPPIDCEDISKSEEAVDQAQERLSQAEDRLKTEQAAVAELRTRLAIIGASPAQVQDYCKRLAAVGRWTRKADEAAAALVVAQRQLDRAQQEEELSISNAEELRELALSLARWDLIDSLTQLRPEYRGRLYFSHPAEAVEDFEHFVCLVERLGGAEVTSTNSYQILRQGLALPEVAELLDWARRAVVPAPKAVPEALAAGE